MTSGPTEVSGDSVIPLLVEDVSVSKRRVVTGRVRVSTVTHEHEKLVDEWLTHHTVDIERRPIAGIDAVPAIREERETLVIPVVEEMLVVERRLILKEEILVRRVHGTERHQGRVKLREQVAVVTRLAGETPASGEASDATSSEKKESAGWRYRK